MVGHLTISETVSFWGGFKLGQIPNSPVQYADITAVAVEKADYLPEGAKVASIHVGFIPFIKSRRYRGKTFELKRSILAAQLELQSLGYTHIAITGPLPQVIDINKRLKEVGRHRNSRVVVMPNVLGACLGLLFGQVFLLGAKNKLKRRHQWILIRICPGAFMEHVLYRM